MSPSQSHALILLSILLKTCLVWSTVENTEQLLNAPGHLKPFGFSDEYMTIDEIDGFVSPKEFIQKYVIGSKPLLMKNGAKKSKAFTLWTDEYFLNVDEPADSTVLIEAKKKENRSAPATFMSFKDYVRIYNTTDQYLVNSVPRFIAPDVSLPGPLQCEDLANEIVDTVMWFSSGGTKSVVHTDSVDNINCLFRGEKTLIMVDHHKYGDKVDLDRPEGAYSDMDVDQVDFTKYPGMAEVQYYKVKMVPGDCLYIPYKWIHQVRSFGSNLAVNVWWDHHKGKNADLEQCPEEFDPDFTLDMVDAKGFDEMEMGSETVKEYLLEQTQKGGLDFGGMVKAISAGVGEIDEMDPGRGYQVPIRKLFALLDRNENNIVSNKEILETTDEDMETVADHVQEFHGLFSALEERFRELHGEDGEDGDPEAGEQMDIDEGVTRDEL